MAEKIDSQPSLCTSATPEGSNSGNLTMNAEVAFDNNRPNNELSDVLQQSQEEHSHSHPETSVFESADAKLPKQGSLPESIRNSGQEGSKIEVIFHAVIDSSVKQYRNGFKGVFLKFDEDMDDLPWTKLYYEMKGTNSETYVTHCVTVPEEALRKHRRYNYFIFYSDSQQLDFNDESKHLEFRQNRTESKRQLLNRTQKNPVKGSMNQYDGVIRVEQITDRLLSALLTNTMRDDAKKAAYIFIKEKKWANGDDLISCIEDIILDLENVYWDFDPQYIQVVAKKSILSNMLQKLEFNVEKSTTAVQKTKELFSVALTTAFLLHKNSWPKISTEERKHICRLVLPEKELLQDRKMIENYLKTLFPRSFGRTLKTLITLIKPLTRIRGCIDWLYCMPVIHKLNTPCDPWIGPDDNITKTIATLKWWGLECDDFVIDLTNVQEKEILKTFLDDLIPYFDVDCFLPRTVVALFRTKELPAIIDKYESSIPTYIIFAALCKQVSTYNNKKEKKEISACVSSLLDHLDSGRRKKTLCND